MEAGFVTSQSLKHSPCPFLQCSTHDIHTSSYTSHQVPPHRALTSCQTNHYSKGICNRYHVWNPWIFLWTYAFFHHLQCIDYDYMIAYSWPWHYMDCYTIINIIYLLFRFSFSRSCSDIQYIKCQVLHYKKLIIIKTLHEICFFWQWQ